MLLIVKIAHHGEHKSGLLINVPRYYVVNKENRTFVRVEFAAVNEHVRSHASVVCMDPEFGRMPNIKRALVHGERWVNYVESRHYLGLIAG